MNDQQSLGEPAFPAPIATAGSEELRRVGPLANAAIGLIALSILAVVTMSISDWHTFRVVDDYVNGVSGVGTEDLTGADEFTVITSYGFSAVTFAGAIAFIVWLWRARNNAEILCMAPHRRGRGWTIGGWFCPVVNFWFPPMIVNDIWKTSNPKMPKEQFNLARVSGTALVTTWWACLLASYFLNAFVDSFVPFDISVDSLRSLAVAGTVFAMLWAVGGLSLIVLIRQITGWQSEPRPTADTAPLVGDLPNA